MSIGANIRRLREEKEFTQEKIADELGVSFQAVSSWERDEYKPDIDKLLKSLMSLSPHWLKKSEKFLRPEMRYTIGST